MCIIVRMHEVFVFTYRSIGVVLSLHLHPEGINNKAQVKFTKIIILFYKLIVAKKLTTTI